MLNVGIVGRGAIGSLLAGKLSLLNIPTKMLWRKHQQEPMTVHLKSENIIHDECITVEASPLPPDESLAVLVVPVKAYQVFTALTEFRPFIKHHTCIVLLHNGAGTEPWVEQHFPDNPMIRMTTSIAAHKINDSKIIETGQGATQAGWLKTAKPEPKQHIEALFNQLLFPCEWFTNIQIPVWQKLAINAVINPLTAIHDIQNGALAAPRFDTIKKQLLQEFILIANAVNLPFDLVNLADSVEQVIALTAQNYSSMHQDIAHKRQSEVAFINGYLVDIARQHQIPATANQQMLHKIKVLESRFV